MGSCNDLPLSATHPLCSLFKLIHWEIPSYHWKMATLSWGVCSWCYLGRDWLWEDPWNPTRCCMCGLCREGMPTPHRIKHNHTQGPSSIVYLNRFTCPIQCFCWGQEDPFKMLLLTQDLLSPCAGGTSSCIELNRVGPCLLPARVPDVGEKGLQICKLVSLPWHRVSETIDTKERKW